MEGSAVGRDGAPSGAQAIERSLAVLHCFMGTEPELGITEIARRLQLTPSTAHRIVRTLARAGYLEQNPKTEQYHLGLSAVLLGQVAQRVVGLDRVHAVIGALAERTGESVNFVVLEGDDGVVTLRIDTRHPLRFEQPVGTRVGLHRSAAGKTLLAFHPDGDVVLDRLGELEPYTDFTITTRAALERDLAAIRDRGFSLDEQESQLGVRCIAAPVLNDAGCAHAAIAVQIPTARMPKDQLLELAPFVRDAAERTAGLLGGQSRS
jgi:IclR family transcriptional regulator, acetate operon repressor